MKTNWLSVLFYLWAISCVVSYIVFFVIPKFQGRLG